jgi:hypothetical protein
VVVGRVKYNNKNKDMWEGKVKCVLYHDIIHGKDVIIFVTN